MRATYRVPLAFALLFAGPAAVRAASQLEGSWYEAAVGCGLWLDEKEVERLPRTGGVDVYRRTFLDIRPDSYTVRSFSGLGCKEDSPDFDYRSESAVPFYCDGEIMTEGAFQELGVKALFLGEPVIRRKGGAFQDLGVKTHEYGFELLGEVLRLVGNIGDHKSCGDNVDFVTYWIPAPGS